MNLRYNALKIDEIEKEKGLPIENCITDTTIGNIILFIQKGLVDDNGVHGVSREAALSKIDEYLAKNDKQMLVLDIMEALQRGGFLPKTLDLPTLRASLQTGVKKGKASGKSGKN